MTRGRERHAGRDHELQYPIFSFDGDDLFVFETPRDLDANLEIYDLDYPEVLLDSDGRLLRKTVNKNQIELWDAEGNPDPERLRLRLIHALQKRGQAWDDDAPLERLMSTARATWDKDVAGANVSGGISRLFERIRRKTRR